MFSRLTLAQLLPPCALLLLSAGVAAQLPTCPAGSSQASNTVTDQFGPTTPNWPSPPSLPTDFVLHVPKFVPAANQTLIGAEVILGAAVTGSVREENTSNLGTCTPTFNLASLVAIDTPIPGQAQIVVPVTIPNPTPAPTLSVYDGNTDYGGTSGRTFPSLSGQGSSTILITDPTVLANVFTGPGQLSFQHAAQDTSNHAGCGNLDIVFENRTRVFVSVRYIYCVTGETPGCHEYNRRQCGSLLLFPEFDNRLGDQTLVTITNSCCDDPNGGTWVEARFINKEFCTETNRSFFLSACDTVSFLTSEFNPNQLQGYLYVYAKSGTFNPLDTHNPTGTPTVYNHLIGQELIINGIEHVDYSMNAVSFLGLGEEGALNDDDGDGIRDLNGPGGLCASGGSCPEYAEAPDQIFIPRFLGQDTPNVRRVDVFKSQVVLIALSGGAQFRTILDVLGYNDNEEPLSHQYEFQCWDKPYLRELAPFAAEAFLDTLGSDDPDEILGANGRNAGWLRLDGNIANSSGPEAIDDPAFYAVLIERTGAYMAADLPWEYCSQTNGDLLPLSIFGDGPVFAPDDNQ